MNLPARIGILGSLCITLVLTCGNAFSQDNDREFRDSCTFAESYNALGFDLLSKLTKERPNQNVFISPSGLASLLAITQTGAQGNTRRELSSVLHVPPSANLGESNQIFSKWLLATPWAHDSKARTNSGVRLEIANSVWVDNHFEINPAFVANTQKYFDAEVQCLPLSSPKTAAQINAWANAKTHGTIPEILKEPFHPPTVVALLNATYFKGQWTHKFDPKLTQEKPFRLANGKRIQHPRMTIEFKEEVSYLETPQFQAIQLPYGNFQEAQMIVFLPKSESPAKFLQSFNHSNWKVWKDKFNWRSGTLELPRFKLESDYDLKNPLVSLGMVDAFAPARANLNGIGPGLFISRAKQKTFVEVNEEGTEAAAVTMVALDSAGEPKPPRKFKMIVDHPFCVAIVARNGAILFLGVITDPR